MGHKAGFVNILGNPNVGKSTLMNSLVGEKLSIITSKIQTTRHRIRGIVSGEDFQIVFSDTPGIIKPHYKLQEAMMKFVSSAFQDADIFLFVTELRENFDNEDILEKFRNSNIPVIVAINKADLGNLTEVEEKILFWKEKLPNAEIIPISAIHQYNIPLLFEKLKTNLPDGEPFFPKDDLTDKPLRFFVAEIIREKILINYRKEIPYSVEVIIDTFKEAEDIIRIHTLIFVSRESQKMIILGKGGNAIKKLGIDSRKEIEQFLGKHVYLELSVKVSKDWRNNDRQLKMFGYEL